MLKVKILFFVFCSFLMTGFAHPLDQIPKDDREKIRLAFETLVWNDGFAYTIFGSKPVSIQWCKKEGLSAFHRLSSTCFRQYWKVWQKYEHLFYFPNYIFVTSNKGDWLEVILINIPKSVEIFRKFPDRAMDTHNYDDKLGLFLGYGEKNSYYYNLMHGKGAYFFEREFIEIGEDYYYHFLNTLFLPSFVSFDRQETISLLKKYDQERIEINNRYSKGDFLEITFDALMRK